MSPAQGSSNRLVPLLETLVPQTTWWKCGNVAVCCGRSGGSSRILYPCSSHLLGGRCSAVISPAFSEQLPAVSGGYQTPPPPSPPPEWTGMMRSLSKLGWCRLELHLLLALFRFLCFIALQASSLHPGGIHFR